MTHSPSEIERELAKVKRDYELHMAGSAQMEADIAKALRLEVGDDDGEQEYWIPAEPGPLGPFTGIEEAARQFMAFIDKTDASSREQLATLRAENERLKKESAWSNQLNCGAIRRWKQHAEAAERQVAELKEALKRFVENRHIIMPAIAGHDSFKRYFDAARTLLEADRKLRREE